MSYPNWKALAPHRSLSPGCPTYVLPPASTSQLIADWILAGGETVLIGGPAGIGKSTELAHVASLLKHERHVCHVHLGQFENMRRTTVERVLFRVADALMSEASVGETSDELRQEARRMAGVYNLYAHGHNCGNAFHDYLQLACAEIQRRTRRGKTLLILDGLDKLPPGPITTDIFDTLGRLLTVGLVSVIPWHTVFGPLSEQVLRVGERFIPLRALSGRSGKGVGFLTRILSKRLNGAESQAPDSTRAVIRAACEYSGGVPRIFLQLLSGAAVYARMRASNWPDLDDFDRAKLEMQASFQRILHLNDREIIQDVAGQSGAELELSVKARLLAHGILLERELEGKTVLAPHPCVYQPRQPCSNTYSPVGSCCKSNAAFPR